MVAIIAGGLFTAVVLGLVGAYWVCTSIKIFEGSTNEMSPLWVMD